MIDYLSDPDLCRIPCHTVGLSVAKYPHLGACLAVITDPLAPQVLSIEADKISNAVTAGLNAAVLEQATVYISLLTLQSTITKQQRYCLV